MIYTSYFSSKKYAFKDGVSVARYVKFPVANTCPELYPDSELLSWWKKMGPEGQKKNKDKYTEEYRAAVLSKLDVHELAAKLDGKVLLCYEKSSDFCHRHIIAEWFRENGYPCEEL